MKVIWVCFSLFTLLLAPFSVGQSQAMVFENTNMSNHHEMIFCAMHATPQPTSETPSGQHDCGTERLLSDLLTDNCESLECGQDCVHCLGSASSFATLHMDTVISPFIPVTNNSGYHFSLQVMIASPQTPPPNA